MRTVKTRLAIVGTAVLFVCAAATPIAYAYLAPDSTLGLRLFGLRYGWGSDRPGLLRAYAVQLEGHNDGFVPAGADALLVRRYMNVSDDAERLAIVDFFVHFALRSRRTRQHFAEIGEPLVADAMGRLGSYDAPRRLGALALIECARLGRPLSKPCLTGEADDRKVLAAAVQAYRKWWAADVPWEEKKAIDPLAGSPCEWVEF